MYSQMSSLLPHIWRTYNKAPEEEAKEGFVPRSTCLTYQWGQRRSLTNNLGNRTKLGILRYNSDSITLIYRRSVLIVALDESFEVVKSYAW